MSFPQSGHIPMSDTEKAQVMELIREHGSIVSLTRRDPGETGPVVVHLYDGTTVEIDYVSDAHQGLEHTERSDRSLEDMAKDDVG